MATMKHGYNLIRHSVVNHIMDTNIQHSRIFKVRTFHALICNSHILRVLYICYKHCVEKYNTFIGVPVFSWKAGVKGFTVLNIFRIYHTTVE